MPALTTPTQKLTPIMIRLFHVNFRKVKNIFTVRETLNTFRVKLSISFILRHCCSFFSDFGTQPKAPTIIGMNINLYCGYITWRFHINRPQVSVFSAIFFEILISAGQLNSMMIHIFSVLFQITRSGLLCFNFVAVVIGVSHQYSLSLVL